VLADWREAEKALRLDAAFLAEVEGRPLTGAHEVSESAKLVELLHRAAPGRERDVIVEEVRARACKVLGLAPEHPIDPDRPLSDLGLDSLMAIELRNALSAAAGKTLPSTLVFNYPSTGAMAGYLAAELASPRQPLEPSPTRSEEEDFISRLEQLTEGEVERMLNDAAERIS
jgi:acyl carrier protein